MRGDEESGQIGLAEAIEQVRSELVAAQSAGAGEEVRFVLGEVTLEFAVDLAREVGGEAGVKLWVVNVGGSGSVTSTKTNTVKVTMNPKMLDDDGSLRDVDVTEQVDRRPPVGGR